MPLDTRIPLAVNQVDLPGSLKKGLDIRDQRENAPKRTQLLDLAVEGRQLQNQKLSAEQDFDSVLQGALGLDAIVGSQDAFTPEVQQSATQFLSARLQDIQNRGGDASGTEEALRRVQAGDMAGIREAINGVKSFAVQTGKLKAPADTSFTLGKDQKRFDAQGNVIAEVGSTTDKAKVSESEQKLRKEFSGLSKEFALQNAAFGRVQASANNPSAAGDLALIFNYMKILDPGSTVREGEFATAQNSAGVPKRIRAKFNQVVNGERLDPDQRADFFDRAKSLYSEAVRQHDSLRSEFGGIASRAGLEPENVLIDFRSADLDAPVNLRGERERKTLGGKVFEKIAGEWFLVTE
jgi:hypothetical protein